jgi:KUP system potassium uptake protein
LLEQERAKLRQREDEFIEWVINTPPIRLPGAAAIFTAATTGIPLGLTHHLKHNRVLHERVLFIASVSVDAPRVEDADRVKLVPVGAGITRVLFHFGFMETPDIMEGLRYACRLPELQGIDPENITYYFRRVMVIASNKASGMAVWRKALLPRCTSTPTCRRRISESRPPRSWRSASKSKFSYCCTRR